MTGVGAPQRANLRFMLAHPAHAVALGFGSGLSPRAPGTVGTLWAWATFALLDRWLGTAAGGWGWPLVLGLAFGLGWWACTRTAQALRVSDPSAVVWDEVVAFWLLLWLIQPTGWVEQLAAFGLFRLFDAAKPGPVGWADRGFKAAPGRAIGAVQGLGILVDDLVAALCALLPILMARAWMGSF
ncbi:MAG: hypothetical protein RLZ83_1116 [Pseudomonadota bacterium]|jgi:phosphatidylglycerophosphatase A